MSVGADKVTTTQAANKANTKVFLMMPISRDPTTPTTS
jgi:hypothetical protein